MFNDLCHGPLSMFVFCLFVSIFLFIIRIIWQMKKKQNFCFWNLRFPFLSLWLSIIKTIDGYLDTLVFISKQWFFEYISESFFDFLAECFLFVFIMMMMIRISINQNRYSNHQGCYIHKFPEIIFKIFWKLFFALILFLKIRHVFLSTILFFQPFHSFIFIFFFIFPQFNPFILFFSFFSLWFIDIHHYCRYHFFLLKKGFFKETKYRFPFGFATKQNKKKRTKNLLLMVVGSPGFLVSFRLAHFVVL